MGKAKTLVIGVAGTMTSGKAAVEYFLVSRGFKSIKMTEPILEEGMKRKLDMKDRSNWLKIMVEMRKKQTKSILAEIASQQIQEDERYVICPIRYSEDIKYLKKQYDSLILFIDAPTPLRYRRTFLKAIELGMTESEFKKKDSFERNPTGKDKEYLSNVEACRKLADEVIVNEGSLDILNQKLDAVLRKYHIPDIEDTGAYEDFQF